MKAIIILLGLLLMLYIANQIMMFYDIDINVILPYLTWIIVLCFFYLILGKTPNFFSEN